MRAILTFALIIVLMIAGAYFFGQQMRAQRKALADARSRQVQIVPPPMYRYPQTTWSPPITPASALDQAIKSAPTDPQLRLARASIRAQQLDHAAALQDTTVALDNITRAKASERASLLAQAYKIRYNCFCALHNYPQAAASGEKLVALHPKDAVQLNNVAWLLATCPDANARNGTRAIELATKACKLTQWTEASYIDTLAAAYAADGQFNQAIDTQQKAIKVLGNQADDLASYQDRLQRYRNHETYQETPEGQPV